ncbi:MAG: hypothetical protein QG634_345 [Patescibacteria group bacterium]|nr:hypothetical protein [Patescibacteria group bacterium]
MKKKLFVIFTIFIIIISIFYFFFVKKNIKEEIDFKPGHLNPDIQDIITNIPPQDDQ